MTHPNFLVHPTRRIVDDEPIAATITPDFGGIRFAGPAPRPLRADERLYISGAFTVDELERIAAWARGGR